MQQSTRKHHIEQLGVRHEEYLTTVERCQKTGKIEISLRYCTQCLIDMPLRARHCRMCQKCVSTYDHHCPWLGNCVGERNRKHFYIYLWLQQIQLIFAMILSLRIIEQTFGKISLILVSFFMLFVVYLIVFHSYLAATNTTTWECLSWDKISYLKLWPKKLGSPFNIGLKKNLRLYFCFNLTGDNYFVWRLPKRRPDILLA